MDFSKLSDEELIALKSGDLSKLSNDALVALRDAEKPPGFGNVRDLVSGVNRNVGMYGDSLVAAYNMLLPKEHEVQPLSQSLESVGVEMDRPRSYMGMVGEYFTPGPGGLAKNLLQTGLAAGGGYLARRAAPDSLLAEIAGAMAPNAAGFVKAGAQEGVRRAVRGADPTAMAARVARADEIGAPLTVGTGSQNKLLQVFERLSGSVPGGVTPFRKAGEAASVAIRDKLASLTGGRADDTVRAGRVIQKGLFDPDTGWTARTKKVNDSLYSRLDEKLSANDWWANRGTPEGYPATVSGGPELQQPWPSARWADDVAPIMREPLPTGRTGLNRRQVLMGRTPENIPVSPDVDLPAAPPQRAAGAPSGFQAVNTRQFIASANKGVRGAPDLSEQLFKDKTVAGMFDAFANDIEAGNGNVPYEAIKRLRTEVGDMLGDPQLIGSSQRELLKKFYASLSDDMAGAAAEAERRGVKGAVKDFERANSYHKARVERIEDFYDALYKKTTPEEVWGAVIGDNPRSPSRLSAIRKAVTPQEWDFLRKTVITRMGKPVASAAIEGGTEFSAGTFLTNYERMKGTGAIDQIFGKGQYRKDIDSVAQYASDLRSSAEVLSNPSGTAGLGLSASVYYGALGMAGMALAGSPAAGGLVGIGAGLVANSTAARLMSNQRFVHWLAKSTKIPPNASQDAARHLARLPQILGNDPRSLEDAQEFIAAVMGQ
jgi:hypothetical protein